MSHARNVKCAVCGRKAKDGKFCSRDCERVYSREVARNEKLIGDEESSMIEWEALASKYSSER
jgi:hypothetical protein